MHGIQEGGCVEDVEARTRLHIVCVGPSKQARPGTHAAFDSADPGLRDDANQTRDDPPRGLAAATRASDVLNMAATAYGGRRGIKLEAASIFSLERIAVSVITSPASVAAA